MHPIAPVMILSKEKSLFTLNALEQKRNCESEEFSTRKTTGYTVRRLTALY